MHHIIWNVLLTDKEAVRAWGDAKVDELRENNVRCVIAILPHGTQLPEAGICFDSETETDKPEVRVMEYHDHTMSIDTTVFDDMCRVIEEHRSRRSNVLVYCNSGYQRSIPFLAYYLIKYHRDEVPTPERAVDIILPQVDKANYASLREGLIRSIVSLLGDFLQL